MQTDADFDNYLILKKVDPETFRKAEPDVWNAWKNEFEQMHPNSFTVQKLNLINPIRRKYPLKIIPEVKATETSSPAPAQAPKPGKPVMRPRPKTG